MRRPRLPTTGAKVPNNPRTSRPKGRGVRMLKRGRGLDRKVQETLRAIPAVHTVMKALPEVSIGQVWVDKAVRLVLSEIRERVIHGNSVPELPAIISEVLRRSEDLSRSSLRPVLNATGVVIHTNLGRAPLPDEVIDRVAVIARGYSTLEYRLDQGQRGSRHDHIERLLTELFEAEAAMVVNNNAAAVLLTLSALAKDKEVVVSRGELVEIGGSFRIPEVMALSGARLREVGATNKTHLADYERVINPDTALLLKVHQSNFRMVGFTHSVETGELVSLGRERGLPVMEDLGSGVLFPFRVDGHDEPSVQMVLESGVDVVTFSGDKLLGGPQAGIIVGRRAIVGQLKKHPLARAVRVDKMTLAALEVVFRWYLEGRARDLPLWQMIDASTESLKHRAETLVRQLEGRVPKTIHMHVEPDWSEIGGGSMPGTRLPTYVVKLGSDNPADVVSWERLLREAPIPVISRIQHDWLIFDLRTIFPSQETVLIDIIKNVLEKTLS